MAKSLTQPKLYIEEEYCLCTLIFTIKARKTLFFLMIYIISIEKALLIQKAFGIAMYKRVLCIRISITMVYMNTYNCN